MSLIDGLLGNASSMNAQKVQKDMADVLVPEETVEAAFRIIRDMFVFTDQQLILVDKQGLTSKKWHTNIPYKSIKYFSVETAGRFDRDAELKIWVPVEMFQKN